MYVQCPLECDKLFIEETDKPLQSRIQENQRTITNRELRDIQNSKTLTGRKFQLDKPTIIRKE